MNRTPKTTIPFYLLVLLSLNYYPLFADSMRASILIKYSPLLTEAEIAPILAEYETAHKALEEEQNQRIAALPKVEWTGEDAELFWSRLAESADRTSTTPRWKDAEDQSGEGLLETFGTRYMPNAYAVYQEARAAAKEREQLLTENFPKGRTSDATGGALYDKVSKACAKAVFEMFRRHDELCHFYLLHRTGAMEDSELAELDQTKLQVVLPSFGEPPAAYSRTIAEPSSQERDFAQKYLPETWAGYQRLENSFADGVKNYAAWRRDAILVDAVRSDVLLGPVQNTLNAIGSQIDGIVNLMKEQKLLYAVGETTASKLAEVDRDRGNAIQKFEKITSTAESVRIAAKRAEQSPKERILVEKRQVFDAHVRSIRNDIQRREQLIRQKAFDECDPIFKRKAAEAERIAQEKAEAERIAKLMNKQQRAMPQIKQIIADMISIPGKRYSMGKTEVTQAQWEAIMGGNPSKFKGANNPVESVSWYDCEDFLETLNAFPIVVESGISFRFPTREEWYFACLSGASEKSVQLSNGNIGAFCKLANGVEITENTLNQIAWFGEGISKGTHPVGLKEPNAFGLYDMFGNVEEWTSPEYLYESVMPMGGCYYSSSLSCGITTSGYLTTKAEMKGGWIGFRLCTTTIEGQLSVENTAAGADTDKNAKEEERRVKEEQERTEKEKAAAPIRTILEQMVPIPGKEYMMGKYEVTHAQWLAVMKIKPKHYHLLDKPDPNHPVAKVTYSECRSFLFALNCNPLVKRSGFVFRLPKPDEWEYACRAGGHGKYGSQADGSEVANLNDIAWYRSNSGGTAHPIGQKNGNGYGLYDMVGNVREWTEMGSGFFDSPTARGGDYDSSDYGCEISHDSLKLGIDDWSDELGFRLCANAMPGRAASVEAILAGMVAIPGQDYLMGKYEVTQGQWEAVTGKNPSKVQSADKPANYVSWDDCQEFIQVLNTNSTVVAAGLVFRLPWAEEWEYACKAGAKGKYCRMKGGKEVKESNLEEVAWFEKNAQKKTFPVGEKMPNDFGLYDMLGNVSEWCQEHQSEIREVESTENGKEQLRVACGGNLFDSATKCEAGQKRSIRSSARNSAIGLRLCAEKR